MEWSEFGIFEALYGPLETLLHGGWQQQFGLQADPQFRFEHMAKFAGIEKLYYSIGEVAAIVEEETHVLRFWEDQFEQLSPRRNRAGRRIYSKADVEMVETIWHLVKVEKYTLEGARQVLSRGRLDRRAKSREERELRRLRAFLENISKQLAVQRGSGT